MLLDLVVFLASLLVGRDPACLQDAMDMLGYDTRRADVREAVMARAKVSFS